MAQLDQIIAHAADLQQKVDELDQQVVALALAGLGLALAVMILSWKLWHES